MRYVTVVAYPDEDGINRLDRRVNELGLAYRAIHHMELLADDTVAMFAEAAATLRGSGGSFQSRPRSSSRSPVTTLDSSPTRAMRRTT